MKQITFYLDFISPYAYLAFEQLPQSLQGLSYAVTYKPVLLGALLRHHGQLGPAEIPAKRDWTYRHVMWLGRQHQVELAMPQVHPFNPLPLLRLALACAKPTESKDAQPNRYVCETLFQHVWRGGADALNPQRLQAVRDKLGPAREPEAESVKAQLRANTDEAISLGVFGVPTLAADDKLFWGFDALSMLRAYLQGDAWFDGPGWDGGKNIRYGLSRKD
jgi:2-hydroxychromene-2-carboxylate isomerase